MEEEYADTTLVSQRPYSYGSSSRLLFPSAIRRFVSQIFALLESKIAILRESGGLPSAKEIGTGVRDKVEEQRGPEKVQDEGGHNKAEYEGGRNGVQYRVEDRRKEGKQRRDTCVPVPPSA
ncbi:hypothetical protein KM043_008560 [Ampulex compressa]|nr:hypothetical protein KM043_008560 [Ampulex compressa]